MMRRMKYLGPIFLVFFFFVACTPNQPVRPYPAFVVAAIDPGDQVTVVTKDGETLKFIVVRVDENSLSSEDRTIPVADIEQLHKKSKNKPAYPCGKDMPLGCSIPKSIIATENVGAIASSVWGSGELFKWHTSYADDFYEPCLQHEFCYRHGFTTYSYNRSYCDDEFYENMLQTCNAVDLACKSAAKEFYIAVSKYSEEHFKGEAGVYCEYDGPAPKQEQPP